MLQNPHGSMAFHCFGICPERAAIALRALHGA